MDSKPSATSSSPFTISDVDKEKSMINEKLLRSVAKRYPDPANNGTLVKEFPQFSNKDVREVLADYSPASCSSLYGNDENVSTPSTVASSAKITIDGWDVEKAVSRLIKGANEGKHGVCAKYVELAIQAGGGPLSTKISTYENGANSYHATNLRYYDILKKHDFVQISDKDLILSPNQTNVPIRLQAGDVAIIGKNAKLEGGEFHACMWSGEQWISDFKQKNLNVYGSSYPCAIYRFKNKQGAAKV